MFGLVSISAAPVTLQPVGGDPDWVKGRPM
jgi:hypothetical protein